MSIELIQQVIYSLAIALLLVQISRLPQYSLFFSALVFVLLLFSINLIPLYRGSSLVEILRGAIGDVSISSGVLLFFIIIKQLDLKQRWLKPILSFSEKLALVILGLILYLASLGFLPLDLYHLGYLAPLNLLIFSLVLLILIGLNRPLAYVWLIALLGFYFQLQSSNNLWDYCYDPILWLVLLFDLLTRLLSRIYLNKRGSDRI